MTQYEFKCEQCKRPADYEEIEEGRRVVIKECQAPNCDGKVILMLD